MFICLCTFILAGTVINDARTEKIKSVIFLDHLVGKLLHYYPRLCDKRVLFSDLASYQVSRLFHGTIILNNIYVR